SQECLEQNWASTSIHIEARRSVTTHPQELVNERSAIFSGPSVFPLGVDAERVKNFHITYLVSFGCGLGLLARGVAVVHEAGAVLRVPFGAFVNNLLREGAGCLLAAYDLMREYEPVLLVNLADDAHGGVPPEIPRTIHDLASAPLSRLSVQYLGELGEHALALSDKEINLKL